MATADKILLGNGVFSIGASAIALTRGGGSFEVERDFRDIVADGDYGPVEGRVVIDKEVAKLTVNALDMFTAADMEKYFSGTDVTTTTGSTWKGTLAVASTDYVDVTWTGKTKDGKSVTITLTKCLSRDNISFKFEDKNEVIPQLVFTAHYTEAARTTPPWSVLFAA